MEVEECVATILRDTGVNGTGLLQLTDEEAKEIFPYWAADLLFRCC